MKCKIVKDLTPRERVCKHGHQGKCHKLTRPESIIYYKIFRKNMIINEHPVLESSNY